MKICRITLSTILAVAMTVTMMPWLGGATGKAYAETVPAPGGTVASNSDTDAVEAFGSGNVTAEYNQKILTITLQNDIELSSSVLFQKGITGDTVKLDLNGHSITCKTGTSGTNDSAASGKNAVEIKAADYDVIILGPGTITRGKGPLSENSNKFRV